MYSDQRTPGVAKDTEWLRRAIDEIENSSYQLLSSYVNSGTKIHIRHKKCGYDWWVLEGNFIRKGSRCPKCSRKRAHVSQTKTNEDFLKEVRRATEDEYTFLENYNTGATKIKLRHNICGCEYYVTPRNFLKGCRCPSCAERYGYTHKRKTNEEFDRELHKLRGTEYMRTSPYKGTDTDIRIQHTLCGNTFVTTPYNLLRKAKVCPYCYMHFSKGEDFVKMFLNSNGLNYVQQKTFKLCKDINKLPFDFYLVELNVLIEYDGEQHYKENLYFGHDSFVKTQKHDVIKNQFAKRSGIKLIRVPYTCNTPESVSKFIKSHLY